MIHSFAKFSGELSTFIAKGTIRGKTRPAKEYGRHELADGSLSEEEIALLIDRCSALGLREEDLEKAISFALSSD